MKTRISVQERLKDLRVERGLNLEELAQETGISKSALGSYENDNDEYKEINHGSLLKLADFYKVSVDYLLGLTNNRKYENTPIEELHLSDEVVELLKSERFNNRLLCEIISHEKFRELLADAEIYVDGIATMHFHDTNSSLAALRAMILEEHPEATADRAIKVLEACQVEEDMVLNRMPINRLVAAKHVITQFVDSRPDDRIGIVGFAGKTKSFCPLTLDHALVNGIIRDFHPRMIQADGTAIGSAIAAAATRLDDRKDTKSKIIILVTDGASNSGQISPLVAAENAAKLGIKIYTIAVGTEEGTLANGMVVQSEFDEPTLRKIAQLTGGEHFRATNMASFNKAFASIGKLEKSEAKVQTVRYIEEYFMYFLVTGAALTLLGLSLQVLKPAPAP